MGMRWITPCRTFLPGGAGCKCAPSGFPGQTMQVSQRRQDSWSHGQEGLTKEMIGRRNSLKGLGMEKHYGGRIVERQKLGCSCDWKRKGYHGEGLSNAVRKFCPALWKGLITREKNHQLVSQVQGPLYPTPKLNTRREGVWHKIPAEDNEEYSCSHLSLRCRDTGVIVHPDDERYKHLVGKPWYC